MLHSAFAAALGFLGAGLWWLVMCTLLVSTLHSPRIGIIAATTSLALVIAAGYAFISGIVSLPVDANAYMKDPASWLSFVFGASVMPFVVFQAIALFQQSTIDLLEQVHRQREEIEKMATHDQLTGLLLLNLAQDRLQMALNAAQRSGKKVALLFIDLDGFKAINDSFGHAAGDCVLKEVSTRLMAALRDEDTAARIGGDEFILILGNLDNASRAAQVAERIIGEISRPIEVAGNLLSVGASIGIGLYPDHADNAQTLRRVADEAMYVVKKSGKNRFAFAAAVQDAADNSS